MKGLSLKTVVTIWQQENLLIAYHVLILSLHIPMLLLQFYLHEH